MEPAHWAHTQTIRTHFDCCYVFMRSATESEPSEQLQLLTNSNWSNYWALIDVNLTTSIHFLFETGKSDSTSSVFLSLSLCRTLWCHQTERKITAVNTKKTVLFIKHCSCNLCCCFCWIFYEISGLMYLNRGPVASCQLPIVNMKNVKTCTKFTVSFNH